MTEPSEDVYGSKMICHMMGGVCWRTARKELEHLEKATGLKLLHRRKHKPYVIRRVYIKARMMVSE